MQGVSRSRVALAAILALLLLSACTVKPGSQPQSVSAANVAAASGADRQGHFKKPASDMSSCVGFLSHERYPELQFDLFVGQPETVRAKRYQSDEKEIWVAEFYESGGMETDAVL